MIRIAMAVLLPLLAASGGCRLIALFGNPPTKDVAAEYPYLEDKWVCIVVRAPMETLFEFPHVQRELADHVRIPLEGNLRGVRVVDPRKVADFQRDEPAWETMDPALLGKRFHAARVLELDLTQYTTRQPESPHLYRGHITAAVRVYNADYPNSQPAYRTEVQTVYPPNSPGQWGTSDKEIRQATMEAFAQQLVGKFYDRKVKVE